MVALHGAHMKTLHGKLPLMSGHWTNEKAWDKIETYIICQNWILTAIFPHRCYTTRDPIAIFEYSTVNQSNLMFPSPRNQCLWWEKWPHLGQRDIEIYKLENFAHCKIWTLWNPKKITRSKLIFLTKYSRVDRVKFVEDSL